MIQGVIFDMDGLMFDTERMWATFWRPALKECGLPYKEGLDAAMRGTAGEVALGVLRSYYGKDCDAQAVWDTFNAIAARTFAEGPPVPKKPGLDELLAWLDGQGVPMAVASSSPEALIEHHLAGNGLRHYFKAIISGANVERSKPDPQMFLLAAKAIGVPPAQCLVLEDSYNGVRAGAAGGFVTVMVPDLAPADGEMRRLYTMECASLFDVLAALRAGRL